MKPESHFAGICIGGPYDGQMHTRSSPAWEVAELPREHASALTRLEPDSTIRVTRSLYDYVPITHAQGVWVHESERRDGVGLSVIAVRALIERYAATRGGRP